MYQVGVIQRMTARHNLPGAAPGEQEEHSHHYVVEVVVMGEKVDELGYLVDISELKAVVSEALDIYRGSYLNTLDDFRKKPPSLENLSRALTERIAAALTPGPTRLAVKVWEDEEAWAGHERELGE